MDTLRKVEVLGQSAQYDLCGDAPSRLLSTSVVLSGEGRREGASGACGTDASRVRDDIGRWIHPAVMPDGKRVMLLKVLLSNACENDCFYCFTRRSRDFRRTSFQPEELARLFDELHRARMVQGLFLSSAVCGGADQTMARMIATVEILRFKYEFPGYVHLKIMPGADFACVERAVQLADRVSVNLEAPNAERLARLTGSKDLEADLLSRMRWVKKLLDERGDKRASQTTQFVVGAAGESDREILQTTERLYRELDLARVYFSAFQPVKDTPLENHPPTPLLREHRLYQTDFLFRRYRFRLDELIFDESGNLPSEADPKMMWALSHPERFPIEVNRASREELLRVPGIGPKSASRIVKLRRKGKFHTLADLKKIGAVAQRAAPFILLNGRHPPFQLNLSASQTPQRACAAGRGVWGVSPPTSPLLVPGVGHWPISPALRREKVGVEGVPLTRLHNSLVMTPRW